MNYNASVRDFFKSPKWPMNALLGAVSILIPIVGPIVLSGWHVTIFWTSREEKDPANYPPFDFDYFGKYLERGLWPFLVSLVTSLVLIPVAFFVIIPFFIFFGLFNANHHQESGVAFGILVVGMFVLQIGLMLIYHLLVTPLMLRATITQDFAAAFNFAFLKDFMQRVWKELLVTMLFLFGLGLCAMIFGIVTCYIGMFFAIPLVIFSWHHLQEQIYQLYLSRGGAAIPLSAKLSDSPPPLPIEKATNG